MTLLTETRAEGGTSVARLRGTVDREAGEALDRLLPVPGAATALELDFTDVDYINSSGIALLVGLLGRARAGGIALRATGLTTHYRHIFDITRLSDFIEVVEPAEP